MARNEDTDTRKTYRLSRSRASVSAGVAMILLTFGGAGSPAQAKEEPDLTGVWTLYLEPGQNAMSAFAMQAPELPLTAEGKKRSDEYKKLLGPEAANPGTYCVAYGMPTMMEMAGAYPIEFIQKPDQVTIIYEVEGETRRVYLGARNLAPEDRIPSRQGYSSGHWEGNTLVVETDSLTDGEDQIIHPRSDQAKIVERFTLTKDAKGTRIIDYTMTMTDPVYYTQPVTSKRKWMPLPDGHIIDYNCSEEAWLKLLDLRRKQLRDGVPVTATMKDAFDYLPNQ